MAKLPLVAACLLLAVGPATGSLIETTSTGLVTYQFDGATVHDAPDTCEGVLTASERFEVLLGNTSDGMLVPGDDEIDHFILDVDSSDVGDRVFVYVSIPVQLLQSR